MAHCKLGLPASDDSWLFNFFVGATFAESLPSSEEDFSSGSESTEELSR